MKKFWSILLALMLVVSMTTVFASAEEEGATPPTTTNDGYTITVTRKDGADHTYEIYQIFTGDVSTNTEGAQILSNVKWGTNAALPEGATVGTEVSETVLNALTAVSGQDDVTKLATIKNYYNAGTPVATCTKDNNYTSDKLPSGYYLIKDMDGTLGDQEAAYTLLMVKILGKDITVNAKSEKPTMVKKIKDTNDTLDLTTGWQDTADYDIGDKIPFRLSGTVASDIAKYDKYKFEFYDEMEEGLTFDGASTVKVYIEGDGGQQAIIDSANYSVETYGDHKFAVKFDNLREVEYYFTEGTQLTIAGGTTIHVEYTATLNENAKFGKVGNLNKAYLKFSNNPNTKGEGAGKEMGKTPEDQVIAFTYKLVINKVHSVTNNDGVSVKEPLKGATFTLYKKIPGSDPDNPWVKQADAVLNEEGTTFTFKGLDDGDYKLEETVVPVGYNKLADVYFTLTAAHEYEGAISDDTTDAARLKILTSVKDGSTTSGQFSPITGNEGLTADIENKSGATLPETGGIGTTIFYVLGGLMFVGAALTLVVRRKAEADEI